MNKPHYKIFISILILNFYTLKCQVNSWELNGQNILDIGEKYTALFYNSQLDSLIKYILDPNYKLSELKSFREHVKNQLEVELSILNIQYGVEPWQYYYVRYSKFQNIDRPVKTLFTFDRNEKIRQFSVEILPSEAPSKFLDYKTKTKLSLPFKGEWFVGWGGRTINENQHTVSREQRFAYDFIIRKGCKTFKEDGKSNSDYYCYNQVVIAPGPGKVVEVINSISDNKPGQMPKIHGNRVVIDHGNDEYSILAHFKKGSIEVKVDDIVITGQYLGLTGNSGHSSEPHIHYHLQNTPNIDNGEGLPIKFVSYTTDGKYIEIGEPKIGERIKNEDF